MGVPLYGEPRISVDRDRLLSFFRTMLVIRKFEDEVQRAFVQGLVHGTTHLCQGQEAIAVGVAAALRESDYVTATYRGHGHCIARGMEPKAMFSELMGRRTGICKGKGGSMHFADFEKGVIGMFGIVGAGIPVAVGAAMSAKLRGTDQVSVTFFGDGSTNIGAFHEALNMASVWSAPVVFIIENNLYGEYSRIDVTTPFEDLYRRADAYAMPGVVVDGNDVLAVYNEAIKAVERARSGEGPTLVECKTYRRVGHSRTDPGDYRPNEEVRAWFARDPLDRTRRDLMERFSVDVETLDRLEQQVEAEIMAASKAAAAEPWPSEAEILDDVYA